MTWVKKAHVSIVTKNSKLHLPNFLNRNCKTFRISKGFEQLSSSIGS